MAPWYDRIFAISNSKAYFTSGLNKKKKNLMLKYTVSLLFWIAYFVKWSNVGFGNYMSKRLYKDFKKLFFFPDWKCLLDNDVVSVLNCVSINVRFYSQCRSAVKLYKIFLAAYTLIIWNVNNRALVLTFKSCLPRWV